MRILVVRLGAMGDIIHTLPAVATLRASFPQAEMQWLVESRWTPLLESCGTGILEINRRNWESVRAAVRRLRAARFDLAIDFQGLIKSALLARLSGAGRVVGYDWPLLRERLAGALYHDRRHVVAEHIVERHIGLSVACGARTVRKEFPLPAGRDEGGLPEGDFVLASPSAGWASKEWPWEYYGELARLLEERRGWPLVLNGHASSEAALRQVRGARIHLSSVPGLIAATRQARAVVGLDSGPLHLAAALGKPGVALFGPTDPSRNGPYGGTIRVLRAPDAVTCYKRAGAIDPSMRAIRPMQVMSALEEIL